MKSSLASALLALASSTGTFAWGPGVGGGWGNWPSCANSCMSTFTGSSCAGDGACFCKDTTAISNANSCINTSSCSDSDKETIYENIAQLCADVGVHVTAAPEATFSATSNSAWTGGSGPWSSGGWGAGNGGPGYGPFGGNWGPWGSSGAWTAGPWSAWWDGNACPPDSWTGWTSGTWSTGAPWTTWTACTASTTATTTYTTTVSGSIVTGTSFGVKVAEQTGSVTSSGAISTSTHAGSAANNAVKIGLSFVVVTLVVIVQG